MSWASCESENADIGKTYGQLIVSDTNLLCGYVWLSRSLLDGEL